MNLLFTMCNGGFATTLGLFANYERSGLRNIPASGPLLIVSNHQSNMDPPVVARSVTRRTRFLAKAELFGNPVFTAFLHAWGAHPLRRGEADLQAFRWILSQLKNPDGCVTLFPEGTRNRGGLKRARSGPASVAIRSGATVLPLGITGTEALGGVVRALYPKATIRVRIGTPFRVKRGSGQRKELLDEVTTELMGRIAALLPESHRGVYREAAHAEREVTEDMATVSSSPQTGRAAAGSDRTQS